MKSRKFAEGIDIHIINAPKFKTNLMSIFFNIPLKRETITQAALLPSVLKRGSKEYPTLRDISRKLDDLYSASLGAGVRAKGDGEVLYFTTEYIADKYIGENLTEKLAMFLREIVFEPVTENGGFSEKFVDSEKNNLKNAILGLVNDKKEYTEFKCREAMFDGKGYGMFEAGYVEDLDTITGQSLYGFYQDVLKNAKVDIFISGNVTPEMEKTVEDVLAKAFPPRCAEYTKTEIAKHTDRDVKKIEEEADVAQSKLCIGLRCGIEPKSKEYNALTLATCIFGGSPFSKLFNNVREKLSLAYYAAARTAKFKSVMMISSGIQTENFKAALDEIIIQLDKMKNGEIEDSEIAAAKKYLKNGFDSLGDSLRGMEDYYLSQAILGTKESLLELTDAINKVEKQEISDVMKKVEIDTIYFLKGVLSEEGIQ